MAASVNSCIQAPFATRCIIQMNYSIGTWQGFDYVDAMQSLLEIDCNDMSFLTQTNDIAGPNNPPSSDAMWVSQNFAFDVNGETRTVL